MSKPNPFRYFNTSPEILRVAMMMQVRLPLSLRQVENPLHERGTENSYETKTTKRRIRFHLTQS